LGVVPFAEHAKLIMTTRKSDLPLPTRTPAFVSREIGAAELGISPETWDRWVHNGILPAAAPGFPASTPRWRWLDVDRKLAGSDAELVELQPYLSGIEKIHGPKKESGGADS
jgi:hypothetical protein